MTLTTDPPVPSTATAECTCPGGHHSRAVEAATTDRLCPWSLAMDYPPVWTTESAQPTTDGRLVEVQRLYVPGLGPNATGARYLGVSRVVVREMPR